MNDLWDFMNSNNLNSPVGQKPVQKDKWQSDNARFDRFFEFVSSFRFVDNQSGKIDNQ